MIHWQQFSDVARLVVLGAKHEADARCMAVGPEHLLLALLTLPQGAGWFLRAHNITLQQWRTQLPPLEPFSSQEPFFANGEAISPSILAPLEPISLKSACIQWQEISLTQQSKKVLELAGEEAMRYGSLTIDSEHILLALLWLRSASVGRWLEERDIAYQELRIAVTQSTDSQSFSHDVVQTALEQLPRAKLMAKHILRGAVLGMSFVCFWLVLCWLVFAEGSRISFSILVVNGMFNGAIFGGISGFLLSPINNLSGRGAWSCVIGGGMYACLCSMALLQRLATRHNDTIEAVPFLIWALVVVGIGLKRLVRGR